jgi:hypothetical protein
LGDEDAAALETAVFEVHSLVDLVEWVGASVQGDFALGGEGHEFGEVGLDYLTQRLALSGDSVEALQPDEL